MRIIYTHCKNQSEAEKIATAWVAEKMPRYSEEEIFLTLLDRGLTTEQIKLIIAGAYRREKKKNYT